jgi:hypothetical protein
MTYQDRVDKIIIFSLLEASRNDEKWDRELGPIHLVKYVYLADLAYSVYHNGETFTGTPWRFYNFGPWDEDVFLRINPVLQAIGAEVKKISSPKIKEDFYRYSYSDEEQYDEVYNSLPFEITGPLKIAIHQYGKDTAELLHYVYRTRPMICASPGDYLCFIPKQQDKEIEAQKGQEEALSVKKRKLKKEAVETLKKEMASRLQKVLDRKKGGLGTIPPRYDEVYNEGIKWVENLAGDPINKEEGILDVSPDFWKSNFRVNDELC